MPYLVQKRKYSVSDPFFEELNLYAGLLAENLPVDLNSKLLKQTSSDQQKGFEEVSKLLGWSPTSFVCGIGGCKEEFYSQQTYDDHYRRKHENTCGECKNSFTSAFLLDIHITEVHDPMFKILSQRSKMYRCLVEGCGKKFSTKSKRKQHLTAKHKYPANFDFFMLGRRSGRRAGRGKRRGKCEGAATVTEQQMQDENDNTAASFPSTNSTCTNSTASTLFVSNLPFSMDDHELSTLFSSLQLSSDSCTAPSPSSSSSLPTTCFSSTASSNNPTAAPSSQCPQVVKANVITRREDGKSRGFGYVQFPNDEIAQQVLQRYSDKTVYKGRKISIEVAKPKPKRKAKAGRGKQRRGDAMVVDEEEKGKRVPSHFSFGRRGQGGRGRRRM